MGRWNAGLDRYQQDDPDCVIWRPASIAAADKGEMRLEETATYGWSADEGVTDDASPSCRALHLRGRATSRQRRQVTTLFADIADYTGLVLTLDPEDLSRLVQSYHNTVKAAVEAHGGVVAELLGDGVVVHFGAETAVCDAPDRALEAAADLLRRVSGAKAGDAVLSIRIGISTGLVLAEPDGRQTRLIGANLVRAARLQSIADANTICVSQSARQLSNRSAGFQYLGEYVLKGFREPERVWRFLPEAAALGATVTFPFVGRDAQLWQLHRLWKKVASAGHATPLQILAGPPGIGKSRLLQEFCTTLDPNHTCILFQADQHQANTSFYPIVEWLRCNLAGAPAFVGDRYILGLLHGDKTQELKVNETPAFIRDATFRALSDHFFRLAEQRPAIFIVEDLQWLDRSSLELIITVMGRAKDCPVLRLATCRPEGLDRFPADRSTIIPMPQLSRHECQIAARCFCGEGMGQDVAGLLDRCEGVPILLEHVLRAFLNGWRPASDAVPEMLLGLLTAWIDRVDAAPSTLQHVSVMGRSATLSRMARMAKRTKEAIEEEIDRLCCAHILSLDADGRVMFRHELLREAAYQTLPTDERRSLHLKAADILKQDHRDPNVQIVGEMAFHFEAAQEFTEAARYRHRLGTFGTATGGFAEAETELRRALNLLSQADEKKAQVSRLRASVSISLAANLMQTRGFTDPIVEQAYADSLEQLRRVKGAHPDRFAIYWGVFTYQMLIGRMSQATETAERMAEVLRHVSQEECIDEYLLAVLGVRNAIAFYTGQFECQLRISQQIRTLYRFDRHAVLAAKYGMDLLAVAQAFGPHSAAICGRFDLAHRLIDELDEHQTKLGIPLMMPFMDIWCGVALHYMSVNSAARIRIASGIERADRQGAAFWSATGRMWLAILDFDEFGGRRNRARIEEALEHQRLIGVGIGIPYWTSRLAEAYALEGNDLKACSLAEEALAASPTECAWLAERQRICGFVHELGGRYAIAAHYYKLPEHTARSQKAKLWEAKAKRAAAGIVQYDLERAAGRPAPIRASSCCHACETGGDPTLAARGQR